MDVINSLFQDFGITWPKFISQVILFGIVYFLLSRFAFGPVLNMLEERRRRIEEGQLNAEKIKKQLAEAEIRYQEVLRKANEEATRLLEESRAASEAQTKKQLEQALREASDIIARAKQDIELERQRMLSEARAQLAELVIQTTSKVAGKVLTDQDKERLANETAREISA